MPFTTGGEYPTEHLFDAATIARLKPHQILINSSRGAVVEGRSLKAALKSKKIKAAVLDVYENEPEPDCELLDLLDIATPHIAGYSADGKACGTQMSVRYIARQFGLPLGNWSPEGIPEPEGGLQFAIDAAGREDQEILARAILHTYNVEEDSQKLKAAPEKFESLRENYPVRREPTAYTIQLSGATDAVAAKLKQSGFKVCKI